MAYPYIVSSASHNKKIKIKFKVTCNIDYIEAPLWIEFVEFFNGFILIDTQKKICIHSISSMYHQIRQNSVKKLWKIRLKWRFTQFMMIWENFIYVWFNMSYFDIVYVSCMCASIFIREINGRLLVLLSIFLCIYYLYYYLATYWLNGVRIEIKCIQNSKDQIQMIVEQCIFIY